MFDHNHRLSAEAPRQDRCLDVEAILVAVADQQRIRVIEQGQGNQQFGLASGLKPEVPAAPAAHQLLHHVALLIAFHREDTLVTALVAVLGDRALKCGVKPLQPVFQDVVEANQKGQAEVATAQLGHQIHKVKTAAAFSLRLNADVSAAVDREVGLTPAVEPVER